MRMTETVQKKNIVLIGMPASGKSTVGVILAKILGKDFIDSDIVIQKRGGAALSEIIESEGIDGFIKCVYVKIHRTKTPTPLYFLFGLSLYKLVYV